ncbi:hypothetical protein HO133_006402 [Letharia lupina]|uniref:Uncharacterized protein n=1 Tax=Letharia lupina TaxID=560253 RepID=A0A8H6C6W5_9LECA|nr:uncharacterized protein HO133_006402 [Letharia lupina]KAF6217990.1 hypothetical protein HO133_006402 [Letharia lupina]
MVFISFLHVSLFFISLKDSFAMNRIHNPNTTFLTSNLTLSSLPITPFGANTSLTLPTVHCDGVTYKSNLLSASCADAYRTIPRTTKLLTFGDREDGDFEVPLPYRWVSSDGLCIFEIAKIADTPVAYATLRDFERAAFMLLTTCFADGRTEGGIAGNLGPGVLSLGLIMTSNRQIVQCTGPTGPPRDSCYSIIATMPALKEQQLFSRSPGGHVNVRIPDSFESQDGRCIVTLDTIGREDIATWYEVWAAVMAVDDMCMRFGRVGKAMEIGAFRRLFLEINFHVGLF